MPQEPKNHVRVIMLVEPNSEAKGGVPRSTESVNAEIERMEQDGWLVVNVDQARVVLQKEIPAAQIVRPVGIDRVIGSPQFGRRQ